MGWLSKIFKKATNPMMLISPSTALGVNLKQLFVDPHQDAKAREIEAEKQAAADRAAALEQERVTAAETAAYQQSLLEQARNAAALQSANDSLISPEVSNVIAGGTATQAGLSKKKRAVPSVASSLGLNL